MPVEEVQLALRGASEGKAAVGRSWEQRIREGMLCEPVPDGGQGGLQVRCTWALGPAGKLQSRQFRLPRISARGCRAKATGRYWGPERQDSRIGDGSVALLIRGLRANEGWQGVVHYAFHRHGGGLGQPEGQGPAGHEAMLEVQGRMGRGLAAWHGERLPRCRISIRSGCGAVCGAAAKA